MNPPSPVEPLVSVVVPAYNGAAFIGEALASALAQDCPGMEVIVVDDGSRDATPDIVRSFPGVRCLRQENRGVASARNLGIAQARGGFLAFLDQDDSWLPSKIRAQLARLEAEPSLDFVLCHARILLAADMALPSHYSRAVVDKPFPAYVPSALLARRSAFDRLGAFDTTFRGGDDADWFFRAQDGGLRHGVLPETLLEKRIHGANGSDDVAAMRRELFRVVQHSLRRKRCGDTPPRSDPRSAPSKTPEAPAP